MGMSYDAWKLRSDMDDRPDYGGEHCAYCGTTENLRLASAGCPGWLEPDFICEDCFTGTDTGPGFDDLPAARKDPD